MIVRQSIPVLLRDIRTRLATIYATAPFESAEVYQEQVPEIAAHLVSALTSLDAGYAAISAFNVRLDGRNPQGGTV